MLNFLILFATCKRHSWWFTNGLAFSEGANILDRGQQTQCIVDHNRMVTILGADS
jgi:hypothetical protein